MLCIIIIEELGTTDVSSVSPFPNIKFQEICNELFNEISQVVSLQFQEGRSNFVRTNLVVYEQAGKKKSYDL